MNIYWKKLNEEAILPTKRKEDAGFDIYTIDKEIVLKPCEKRLFGTGLAAAATPGYWLMAFDRGSTGSRGIHTHCGIIDNGYRGEIFICLSNDNDYPVVFTTKVDKPQLGLTSFNEKVLYYPVSKAIAQIIPIPQPEVESREVNDDEWQQMCNTERGAGKLGASGK